MGLIYLIAGGILTGLARIGGSSAAGGVCCMMILLFPLATLLVGYARYRAASGCHARLAG